MPRATMRCPKCGKSEPISFPLGGKAELICDICEVPMLRDYQKVDVGNVTEDLYFKVAEMMKKSPTFSGEDRLVY